MSNKTCVPQRPPLEESRMLRFALILPLFALLGCDVEVDDTPDITYLNMPGMPEGLPFSSAVTLDLAEGGIAGETRQTMDNISKVLQEFGSSMDDVVKCTVFLADMSEWGAMNDIYKTYFKNPPARSALGANGLALNARVEIECIAVTR